MLKLLNSPKKQRLPALLITGGRIPRGLAAGLKAVMVTICRRSRHLTERTHPVTLRFGRRVGFIKKSGAGFTLIESAVAIFILLVGLVAVIAFFPLGIKIVGESQNETFAANIAQSKIEELRQTSYDALTVGTLESKHRLSSDAADPMYYYQRQTVIQTVDANLNVNATDAGLKKIIITVYWQSPTTKAERIYEISTLVSDY